MESVPISFILEEASKHLINVLGTEFTLIKNTPGELEKLKRFKTIIVNVQRDVAGRELSQQDVVWLDEMIDAAYDIEDIVDLSSTKILQLRSNNNEESTCCIHWVIDFFSCTYNTLIFRHEIGTRVQNTFVRLANIANQREYHLTLSGRDGVVGNLRTTMPETVPGMGEDVVLGRKHDLKIIHEYLLFKKETNIEVLILVGMGGVGKTTLAKHVYNDSKLDALFGKRKLWVCVSENSNLSKIIQLFIEQIDKKPCQLLALHAKIEKLKELLEENMYLLVLDDVWTSSNLTENDWSIMKSLFHNCKILVTTREEEVKYVILPKPYVHRVGCLSYDDSRSLFENIAFPNGNVPEELKDISKSIVKKCKGVPLAVNVLGNMMRKKQDHSYWKGIEENNILDLNYIEGENRISKILKFSYYHLPLKSKFCFVYCSIFPKDSVMKKIDLIQQWVGNGFIPLNEGNEIFDDLLSRCFFQDVEKDIYRSITTFKMHDLIHDLAESIAKSLQCGILDDSIRDGVLSDGIQVRYLSIILNIGEEEEVEASTYSYILIKLKDACMLRTLQLLSYGIVSKTFLDNCFTKFKFLRVLVCSDQYFNLKDVPSSIDNLKLLRYVDFSRTSISRLPETICNLQNLQTLKVNNCKNLIVLPKKLGKLSELRYLENDRCIDLDSMPVGMDRLSLLQTLNTFVVNDGGKNLNELRPLDHLEGSLCIKNLYRSRNVVLENTILNKKSKLVSLELDFGYNWKPTKRSDDEKVLQALQPHLNLKTLNIIRFGGFFIPLDMSSLQSLTHLQIFVCPNLTTLPNNMGSLQSLTHLKISSCRNLTCLPNSMGCLQSLTHLEISSCRNLTCLPNSMGCLQSLTHLKISCCENLSYLPNNMDSLKSLTHLEISYCQNLKYLPNNMGSLKSLTSLTIEYCPSLVDDSFALECLTSLKEIKVRNCDQWIRNLSDDAITRFCSVEESSLISICNKDDDIDLLSKWLRV